MTIRFHHSYTFLTVLLVHAVALSGACSAIVVREDPSRVLLQTEGGIKSGVQCTLFRTEGDHSAGNRYISCSDGTHFDQPVELVASATGTPLHLTYANYIGSYVPRSAPEVRRLPGSQRRYSYFDGEPRHRTAQ